MTNVEPCCAIAAFTGRCVTPSPAIEHVISAPPSTPGAGRAVAVVSPAAEQTSCSIDPVDSRFNPKVRNMKTCRLADDSPSGALVQMRCAYCVKRRKVMTPRLLSGSGLEGIWSCGTSSQPAGAGFPISE